MKTIKYMVFPAMLLFLMVLMVIGGAASPSAAIPVNPIATEEKAIEYATDASKMGAPWEIVILTDAIAAQADHQPGIEDWDPIYTTLQFLIIDENVEHYQIIGYDDDDDAIYGWVYSGTNHYIAKDQILSYIGIPDRSLAKLSPEKLVEKVFAAAAAKCNSSYRYSVSLSANTDFETVLTDYIKLKEEDVERVLELYESDYISSWLPPDVLARINDIKAMYGMYQYVDDDGNPISYEGIVFTDGETDVVYYNQLDVRWKNAPYGTDKIGSHGCGPTSMAMVISTLTGGTYDPVFMSNWSYEHGYWCSNSGSYHSLIPGAAQAYGLNVSGCTISDPQRIVDALGEGKLVVALMGKGHFTSSGHYIVLRGVTSQGKILVADPASNARSQQEWDLSIFLAEARKGAAAGGPFWIISN